MVIVTTVNKTKKRDLTHALKALATVDITPAGFALNMVPGGDGYYGYGYYAYSGKNSRRNDSSRDTRKRRKRAPAEVAQHQAAR